MQNEYDRRKKKLQRNMKWKSMLWRKCMNSACQFYHCIRTHMWIEYARSRSEKIYYYCAVMQPTNCWPSTISFIEMLLRTNIMVRGCFGMRQTYVTENRRSSIHDICLTYVSAVASRWIWKNLVSIVFFLLSFSFEQKKDEQKKSSSFVSAHSNTNAYTFTKLTSL